MTESRNIPAQKPGFRSPIEALFGDDFNLGLFLYILRINLIWIVILAVGCFMAITLFYLRYQVPMFQADSTLLLKTVESPNLIDIDKLLKRDNTEVIYQEIELMRSSRFIRWATRSLPLDVSVYNKGNVLVGTFYRNEPFQITQEVLDSAILDKLIYIRDITETKYKIAYSVNGKEQVFNQVFGQSFHTPHLNINVSLLQPDWKSLQDGNYYFVINDRDRLSRDIASNITIALSNYDANKLVVSFRSDHQAMATDITNAMSNAIIANDYKVKAESASQVIAFLDQQIDTLKRELFQQENALREFKEENKLTNPVAEEEYLRSQYLSLEDRRLELSLEETTLNWLEAYLQDTSYNLATIFPPSSEFIDFSAYVNTIQQLQQERANLLVSVKKRDPRVKLKDDQIGQVSDDFRKGLTSARTKLAISQQYIDDLLGFNDGKFDQLPSKEAEFVRLTRLNEIKEKFYLLLLERRSEFEIAKAGLVSDYVLLERAVGATLVSTQHGIIQLAAVIFGLFLGFGLVLFRYMFHNTITSLRDLEKYTNADILGVVPRYPESLEQPRLVITNNPKSLISESFRSLRTNLEFFRQGKASPTLAITSTISGEGKTFIISNLGLVQSLLGKKVVVIDFDLRKPKLHRAFNLTNKSGISTILIGANTVEECVEHTDHEGLDVIPSGLFHLILLN